MAPPRPPPSARLPPSGGGRPRAAADRAWRRSGAPRIERRGWRPLRPREPRERPATRPGAGDARGMTSRPSPPSASFSTQAELQEKLAKLYDVKDTNCIFVFGLRTQVGSFSRGAARGAGGATGGRCPRRGGSPRRAGLGARGERAERRPPEAREGPPPGARRRGATARGRAGGGGVRRRRARRCVRRRRKARRAPSRRAGGAVGSWPLAGRRAGAGGGSTAAQLGDLPRSPARSSGSATPGELELCFLRRPRIGRTLRGGSGQRSSDAVHLSPGAARGAFAAWRGRRPSSVGRRAIGFRFPGMPLPLWRPDPEAAGAPSAADRTES